MSRRLNYIFIVTAYLSLNLCTASHSPKWLVKNLRKLPGLKIGRSQKTEHIGEDAFIPGYEDPFFTGYDSLPAQSHSPRGNWLRLSSEKLIAFVRNPKVLSVVQYGLVAYVAFEILRAVKEVYQEYLDDPDENMGTSSNANAILSPTAARQLVFWLQQGAEERGDPPSIKPNWMIALAQNLHSCHALAVGELYRILLSLTKSQAVLLHSCLLRSSKTVSFNTVGGLSGVKVSMLLLH
jgi:hypothetical protein